jgi:hypothetical protein
MEDIAIKFEAQLVSASMTASGGHKITLRISPEDLLDNPANTPLKSIEAGRVRSLMLQQPNTRFICALVQLEAETDQIVEPKDLTDAKKVIARLSLMVRDGGDEFYVWLVGKFPNLECYTQDGFDGLPAAGKSLKIIKEEYQFFSRKEIMENSNLAGGINNMLTEYKTT